MLESNPICLDFICFVPPGKLFLFGIHLTPNILQRVQIAQLGNFIPDTLFVFYRFPSYFVQLGESTSETAANYDVFVCVIWELMLNIVEKLYLLRNVVWTLKVH